MNIKKSLFLAALPAIMFMSCKQTESNAETTGTNSTETLAAKPETASFTIEGMSCAIGCARTIEKKIASMDGVTKAVVDFEKKEAVVEFDANKQTSEKIVTAVEASADGKTYKVSNVKSSENHAMLFDGEKDKPKEKKKKEKKSKTEEKKNCGEGKSEEKSCCTKKGHTS